MSEINITNSKKYQELLFSNNSNPEDFYCKILFTDCDNNSITDNIMNARGLNCGEITFIENFGKPPDFEYANAETAFLANINSDEPVSFIFNDEISSLRDLPDGLVYIYAGFKAKE